jgi:two-component system, cell cycle sensor histidine kinase and response regulator CckA
MEDSLAFVPPTSSGGESCPLSDSPAAQINLFEFLLENMPDRIYFKDTESRFVRVSRAMAEYFGLTEDSQIIGKTIFDFFTPEHSQAAINDDQEVMRSGVPLIGKEEKVTLPDGRTTWSLTTKMPLRDSDGRIIGTCGISRDITDRKRFEEQMLRVQRLESIGTLASGVAHDLNNILAPILMAGPLIHGALPPELQSLAVSIEKSAQRGADIVRQLVAFAKGAEGERNALQPKYLTEEIVAIARQTFPAAIRIVHESVKSQWQVTADATQMHQVLLNLCVNARDAMPQGGTLTIRTENIEIDEHYAAMVPDAKRGHYVVFSVIDTGTGIPAEISAKIFDPFFTTKEVGKGTGLGLSTVRGIVKSHDGFLNLYSEVGKGTTFKVYLPANLEEASPVDSLPVEHETLRGNGEIILIVDDEEEVRLVLEAVLHSHGYEVLSAADGTEALAIYARETQRIHLVITDFMMPYFDGAVLTRTLRKINPAVKVIASSGNENEARVAELAAIERRDILIKPYTRQDLLEAVRRSLVGGAAV